MKLSTQALSIEQAKAEANLDLACGHRLSAVTQAWRERAALERTFDAAISGFLGIEDVPEDDIDGDDYEVTADEDAYLADRADALNDDEKLGL